MSSMRDRFLDVVAERSTMIRDSSLVLGEIDVARLGTARPRAVMRRRIVNVGIREQLLDLVLPVGLRSRGCGRSSTTYAPFLVERPFEQIKLDLGHQGVGAVLVSIGASYDASQEGRTHQAPEDVALLATLPGWTIHVPGHPTEAEAQLLRAFAGDDRVYVRLSERDQRCTGRRERARSAFGAGTTERRSCSQWGRLSTRSRAPRSAST